MNFLVDPPEIIHHNAALDDEQIRVTAAFVDELLELGVVSTLEEGYDIVTTAPMFCVPKEGQEGEWRVIADMLRGGQNSCIGNDPVFLPRPAHILEGLYGHRFPAVVGASKFFYQFKTHPDDRRFLGLLHPVTNILYAYFGLPMGGANSPSLAVRYGLSFVRLLKESFSLFQGKARANCWWTGFSDLGFDPLLGWGYVLENEHGPSVRIRVFVDDFFIHGPTHATCSRALTFFIDTALKCGMLCHPNKCTPPNPLAKYLGFIFDTQGAVPCLKIPLTKRERALAIVEYLLSNPLREWSRLSLAVAAGILESLVEATP
jgi:hypothetical protein